MSDKSHRWLRLTAVGTIVSAIAASACCWLPLLLLATGASALGISEFFERYRPYLLGATFVLLGLAFYLSYRSPAAAAEGEGAACDTGERCCPPDGKVARLKKANRIMLWIITPVALLFAFFPNYFALLAGKNTTFEATAKEVSAHFAVEKMTCTGCAATIEKRLSGLEGIRSVLVRYEEKDALVAFDPGRITPARICEEVERLGYGCRPIEAAKNDPNARTVNEKGSNDERLLQHERKSS
ncbi:MAG: hypothetical protein D6795_07020 [Deltaproteobacteria bacterium]|nr:MAG: hypothetical protein D6795_07020 [Deltaproteobacteria bacterium]